MDNVINLTKSEIDKIEEERNNKILDLIGTLDKNFRDTKKQLYNILDHNYKNQIVELHIENSKITVNILDKTETNTFILDSEDQDKLFNMIKEIINSTTVVNTNNFQQYSGGKMYKYRFRDHLYDRKYFND